MAKLFSVDGYWKDDGTEFSDLLIYEYDSVPEGMEDEDIFFHGLSEEDLTPFDTEGVLDFVVTAYRIISE